MLISLLLLPALLAGASATPVLDAPPRHGRSVPIARRSARLNPANANANAVVVFDPAFAKQEIRAVLAKYAQAPQFLQGIGLAGDNLTAHPLARPVAAYDAPGSGPLVPPIDVSAGTGLGIVPLTDFTSGDSDILYYGALEVGTPPQRLTVDVDTGSADLWLPAGCADCERDQFEPGASSTYRNQGTEFAVSYGSGDVSGTQATDVVSVAGLTVEEQAFGVAERVSDDFNGYPNDGLIGMAFGSISQIGRPTFFENLMRKSRVAAPLFSVHLSRHQEAGSEICFGCYDASKAVGPVSWVTVVSKTYWSVAMDGLGLDSLGSLSTDIIAAIDTGTTLIYVPYDTAASFYNMVPGAKPAPQLGPEFYTYPCSSKLVIEFSFDGQKFKLDPSDFDLGQIGADSLDCVGGILALGDGFPTNLAVIGDEFLKSWYSTFDYSGSARVGFSPSVNNKN